jgi:hypothetical protein
MPHAEPFAFLFVRFVLSALLLGLLIWWWQAKAAVGARRPCMPGSPAR